MNYRTIWISDIHLGTRGCQAERLLEFLKHNDSDTLFLVGDIIDFWGMRRSWYWPSSHNTVIQKILRKARAGTRVVYIQGNHDPVLETLETFLDMEKLEQVIFLLQNDCHLMQGFYFSRALPFEEISAFLQEGFFSERLMEKY